MAATTTCLISQNLGASVLAAFPQANIASSAQKQDLIQIVLAGSDAHVILNVDYTGAVHYPALNSTNDCRIGQYFTHLTTPASLAAIMADTFDNPSLLDIIQVVNLGGNISYWWDYLGVAHGS